MLFYHYLIPLPIQIISVLKYYNLHNFDTKLNVFANVFSIVFIIQEWTYLDSRKTISGESIPKCLRESRFSKMSLRESKWIPWGEGVGAGDTMKHVKDEGEWRDISISEPHENAK